MNDTPRQSITPDEQLVPPAEVAARLADVLAAHRVQQYAYKNGIAEHGAGIPPTPSMRASAHDALRRIVNAHGIDHVTRRVDKLRSHLAARAPDLADRIRVTQADRLGPFDPPTLLVHLVSAGDPDLAVSPSAPAWDPLRAALTSFEAEYEEIVESADRPWRPAVTYTPSGARVEIRYGT